MPFAATAAVGVFMSLYFLLLRRMGTTEPNYLEQFRAAGWPLWRAFLLISLLPAFVEELAFRGVIQARLRLLLRGRDAVVVQAAMFAVLHPSSLVFVSHFVLGIVLGLLRERTRALWSGFVVHAAWNAWVLWDEMLHG